MSDPPSGPSLFSTGRKDTMGLEGNHSGLQQGAVEYSTVQNNTVQNNTVHNNTDLEKAGSTGSAEPNFFQIVTNNIKLSCDYYGNLVTTVHIM